MALGVYTFSSDGRHRLAVVLRALLIAQLVVSLCMVIYCYNTSMRVLQLLRHVHKVTVLILYGMILLQAYCMKLHYTSGLRLISWFVMCPHWYRLTRTTKMWMLSGMLVSLNGMLVFAACRGTLGALMDELPSSLRIGISQYLTEPSWKLLFDTMQVEIDCCGADAPDDWHDVPWINMDFLNEKSQLVMKMAGTDGRVLLPVSPYSCCTPRVLAACYHDPLQQSEWREVWSAGSPLPSASLHTRGCVEAVKVPLTKALLALQLFSVLVVLLEAFILVLSQLLRTSARDAVLRGECAGAGRGRLLGPARAQPPPPPPPPPPPQEDQELMLAESCWMPMERRRWRRKKPKRSLRTRFSYPLLE